MVVNKKAIAWSLASVGFRIAVAVALTTSSQAQVVPPSTRPDRSAVQPANRAARDAIVTRQRLFSIPFAIDSRTKPPQEIYLYVSGNRGERWSLYQKRPATDRKFDFQAGKDGEYWFAVGTDTVPIRPDRRTKPEKIVIVDTDLPRIDLRISVLSQGRLSARWYAADDTLSTGTFRLSYRTDSATDWKPIDVILPRDASSEFDGEVSWMVNDAGTIYVRGEIMDRAGNVGSIVRDVPVQIESTPEQDPRDHEPYRESDQVPEVAPYPAVQPDRRMDESGLAWRNESESDDAAAPWESHSTREVGAEIPQPENTGEDRYDNSAAFVTQRRELPDAPLGDEAASVNDWNTVGVNRDAVAQPQRKQTRWTSDGQTEPVGRQRIRNSASAAEPSSIDQPRPGLASRRWQDRPSNNFDSNDETTTNTALDTHRETENRPGKDARLGRLTGDSGEFESSRRHGDRNVADSGPAALGRTNQTSADETPPNDHDPAIQITNSKVFNLDYDVSDLGTGELARVELWVTTDDGRRWEPYGTDRDLESPFFVEVSDEGSYGFQLLIHSSSGQSTRPPQSGDRPDISIEVDTSKPDAYLTDAYFPSGGTRMEIEWHASDNNLSPNSITLSYAETLNGPWVIIARDVANTGRYSWDLPAELPRTIHLQIDIVDEAGNRTVHQLGTPTPTKPANPRARIRGIRSGS